MTIEVILPDLGDGIESGDILEILVSEGDVVDKDQGIVEIETDKATVEVPSPAAGRIAKIHVDSGTTVKIGGLLATLEVEVASASAATPPPAAPPQSAPSAEAASEPASPAVNDEVSTPSAPASEPPAASPAAEPPLASPSSPSFTTGPVAAGPAIRRFAREVGVDLATVTGSGPGGRIMRDDVLKVVRQASQVVRDSESEDLRPLPGTLSRDDHGPVSVEAASKIRKTIARNMLKSWSTVPRVTNFDDADVTELDKIRKSSKQDYASKGIKLTSMPFIIKSVAMALREHPLLNAVYNDEAGEIVYKQYVNVGVAVDTERGLVVPVLKDADDKSIAVIAKELATITEKVRGGSFSMDDLRGGTFTISNLGSIGGTYSTPIVNVPEVAILLVGRSRKLPVVVDDDVAVRLMMPLSISYDHRLVDGGAAARFLNEVIAYLEAPGRLLLAP
jgi:pyruvate dehydrogenase E2 component (dihydrolipoamide acetyltransferase)